jgi:hypothetical protein
MNLFVTVWALLPLSAYFVLIGLFQLRTKITVLSGFVDTLLLGIGLSGLITIGPFELFLPATATNRFGWFSRVLALLLYGLILLLWSLSRKPRIVIYNASRREILPALGDILTPADPEAKLVGNSGSIPSLGIDFVLETNDDGNRTAQLISISREVDARNWNRFRQKIREALAPITVGTNPRALWLVCFGLGALGVVAYLSATQWPALAQGFQNWLER